jgi:hypothetical protein
MKTAILIFVIGAAAGYAFGFTDAKAHDENIVVRVVNQVGGSHRQDMRTDVDKQMGSAEQP